MIRGDRSLTNYDAREAFAAGVSPHHIPGRHLYCGPVTLHFGHFLADCVHRLWACRREQDRVESIIFLPQHPRITQSPVFRQFLRLFGTDIAKARYVSTLATVEELVVPDVGHVVGRPHQDWYQEELASAIDLSKFKRPDLPKRIVISRRNYRLKGRIAGADAITQRLREDGYTEVFPEQHPVAEQIAYLVSAEHIIFEEGSAVHLLDPLPRIDAQVAMIRRRPNFTHMDDTITGKADGRVYNNVRLLPGRSPPHNRMSRLIDPAGLFSWLAREGFIASPSFDRAKFDAEEARDIALYSNAEEDMRRTPQPETD